MSTLLFDVPGPRARRRHRILSIVTVLGVIALLGAALWRLASTGQFDYGLWEVFVTPAYVEIILEGLYYTLLAAVMAIAGALVFGMLFGIGKLSDHAWVRWPCWAVVEFFRAVPLFILITYLWALYKFPIGLLAPLVIGLILYNGSVLAETFRAGINAVPKGQVEAAYALGMRKSAVMRIVQLPQAIKIMTPAIISQCIVALKDTSLGYIIVAPGLTYAGRQIWREFDNQLQVALVLGAIYIILNLILEQVGRFAQRRLTESRSTDARPQAEVPVLVAP
ncbi:amino acid ABC transporter permease [Aeromicrobium senzhongii]|uniref:Amino acid ABC transporter permease n=1 Tax=Aeromicrobium senzhongii TaxID=2663859 RepID=A0ABX6SQH4_9ACTN|nr:amino acid ABC transporter permease [Aeromicrobium senzhongii]MTB86851.1 ABC transporter permease subunit [Aeromicrobium senzhongii]QNL93311.1 amino acid ABC transporter permease [Aeromicrobium senzhongii]